MAEIKYKLLIADDEYWTREKIRTMIEWKDYGLEFMDPAENGEEVLQKIEKEKPDILITDINMPFLNGVELVSIVKERYPDIVVFVISGYDDFDYVKTTLMAGAINYLLKPVTKIDLVNAISKALEIISKAETDNLQILKASSLIQDRELSLLVEKEDTPFTPTVTINNNMDFAGCSLILIKIHNMTELMVQYNYDMNLLSYSMKKKWKELLAIDNLLIFNHIYRSNEFIIVTELENSEQKKLAVKILNMMKTEMQSPISIAISEHSYSIESIHTAYIQSVSVLMTRKYKRENVILFCRKEEEIIRKDVKSKITEEMEKKLKSLLKSGNQKAIYELLFENIGIAHCEEQEWEYLEVKQAIKRICNILTDYMVEQGTFKEILDIENLVELADKTIESLDIKNLTEVICEIIQITVTVQKEEFSGTIKDVVKQAVKYINENYFEELTLVSLSEKFNVESSYFSKMFRQETGETLMLYIAKVRMEKAKEYMQDMNINLTEIAFMVGYDDYTYFSRVFRKMAGTSPREYRNSIGTE